MAGTKKQWVAAFRRLAEEILGEQSRGSGHSSGDCARSSATTSSSTGTASAWAGPAAGRCSPRASQGRHPRPGALATSALRIPPPPRTTRARLGPWARSSGGSTLVPRPRLACPALETRIAQVRRLRPIRQQETEPNECEQSTDLGLHGAEPGRAHRIRLPHARPCRRALRAAVRHPPVQHGPSPGASPSPAFSRSSTLPGSTFALASPSEACQSPHSDCPRRPRRQHRRHRT